MNKIYVTQEGFEQYMAALEEIRRCKAAHLKTRSEYGKNSHENHQTGIYDSELTRYNEMIRDLEDTIERLEIVKKEHSTDGRIGLDDIVTVHFVGTDKMMRVQLTGEMPRVDTNQEMTRITRQSPMGAAIYNKKVGDTVSYSVGRKTVGRGNQQTLTIKILSKENDLTKESVEEKQ